MRLWFLVVVVFVVVVATVHRRSSRVCRTLLRNRYLTAILTHRVSFHFFFSFVYVMDRIGWIDDGRYGRGLLLLLPDGRAALAVKHQQQQCVSDESHVGRRKCSR